MNYQETLNYLFSKLPMYQKNGAAAYKEDLGNIVAASKELENPHTKFKSIHIAGTNGKGSVAHMIASIMQKPFTLIVPRERFVLIGSFPPEWGSFFRAITNLVHSICVVKAAIDHDHFNSVGVFDVF